MEEELVIEIDQEECLAQIEGIVSSPLFQELLQEKSEPVKGIGHDQEESVPESDHLQRSVEPNTSPIAKHTASYKHPAVTVVDYADELFLIQIPQPPKDKPQDLTAISKELDHKICASCDQVTLRRMKKLLTAVCTGGWRQENPDTHPGSFAPLIEELLKKYPQKALLSEAIDKIIKNLNKPQTYQFIARIFLKNLPISYE